MFSQVYFRGFRTRVMGTSGERRRLAHTHFIPLFSKICSPLKIILLNLMPTKEETETQLLRLLSNSPLQVDVTLLQAATHVSKNTAPEYLKEFYHTFDEVRDEKYDGMIITGAPVEAMRFEDVDYWDELSMIMEWSRSHVYSTLHICWGRRLDFTTTMAFRNIHCRARCPASSVTMCFSRRNRCCVGLTMYSVRRTRVIQKCALPTSAKMTVCACLRSLTRLACTLWRL